jgi:hypothetical protein
MQMNGNMIPRLLPAARYVERLLILTIGIDATANGMGRPDENANRHRRQHKDQSEKHKSHDRLHRFKGEDEGLRRAVGIDADRGSGSGRDCREQRAAD